MMEASDGNGGTWFCHHAAARGDTLRASQNVANLTGRSQRVEYMYRLELVSEDGTVTVVESEVIRPNPESPYLPEAS